MIPDTIAGFEETEADLAYVPTPGCCADCDDELDLVAWQQELTS